MQGWRSDKLRFEYQYATMPKAKKNSYIINRYKSDYMRVGVDGVD